ncbi:MAG TPA: response regulator [Anaerolineaceae bacterium]|nr:response regulator [Anaerolineaceae bacterium]
MTGVQPRFTVLVMEPDVLPRSVFVRALERAGMRVVVCPRPDDLVALLAEHRPELLIIDAHLPQVNGLEWVGQLRQQGVTAATRVMLVSSLAFPEVVQRAAAERVDDFLVKPVQVDEFLERVRRLLEPAEPAKPNSIGRETKTFRR